MSDLSQLKAVVLEQAHAKGKRLLEEKKQQITADYQEEKKKIAQDKLAIREQKIKERQRYFQREKQQLENQKRQSILVSKQRLLQELFDSAYQQMLNWSEEQEMSFINRVLQKYQGQAFTLQLGQKTSEKLSIKSKEQLKLDYPQVHLADTSLSEEAGFVLTFDRIDDNYLYKNLLKAIWQQDSNQIAKKIFQEIED
ncbi:hypothetical protein [Streptococcus massiliensis]|uniref:V-type sodium ATP synthase, chain E n=1 Tax=Streptococcus massiliensis TaxID=313439 RepID=A0A380KXP6_9STRE|nr:hypothetical protein [Streptococcus massiliensis]SUN76059.1 v-type sodium ATP synthase, chain E [Streptococcus massiliensis]